MPAGSVSLAAAEDAIAEPQMLLPASSGLSKRRRAVVHPMKPFCVKSPSAAELAVSTTRQKALFIFAAGMHEKTNKLTILVRRTKLGQAKLFTDRPSL